MAGDLAGGSTEDVAAVGSGTHRPIAGCSLQRDGEAVKRRTRTITAWAVVTKNGKIFWASDYGGPLRVFETKEKAQMVLDEMNKDNDYHAIRKLIRLTGTMVKGKKR